MSDKLKLISFQAENVKRIRAVSLEFDPEQNMFVITGKNAQGKSSLLDSILLAFFGAKAGVKDIIRRGESEAHVAADIGAYTIERSWTKRETDDGEEKVSHKLVIRAKDGMRADKPQKFLDDLIGSSGIAFDPLEFSRKSPKEQAQILLDACGLSEDVAEIDKRYDAYFSERTDTNRDLKREVAVLDSLDYDEDAPEGEVSVAALIAERDDAQARIDDRMRAAVDLEKIQKSQSSIEADIEVLESELRSLQARIEEAKGEVEEEKKAAAQAQLRISTMPTVEDLRHVLANVNERMNGLEESNAKVRENKRYAEQEEKVAELQTDADNLTGWLEDCKAEKAKLLEGADLPLNGLTVENGEVRFNGVYLSDCSSAEQIHIGAAIAVRMNPKFRIVRIQDGSLLDTDFLKGLGDMMQKYDLQAFVERVDDTTTPGALVIEDGEIVSGAE